MQKKLLNKIIVIIAIAICYSVLLSLALMYVPFDNPPTWFKSLFNKKWQASLGWIKIRHTLIVLAVSIPIGFTIVKVFKSRALLIGLLVGVLPAIYSEILNYIYSIKLEIINDASFYLYSRVNSESIPFWIPLSDFIVIAGAVPAACLIIAKIKRMHNNSLHSA